MKTPRFTDAGRYPNGYTSAAETNIRETFERVQAADDTGPDHSGPDYRTVEEYWRDLVDDRRFREKFGHLLDMLRSDENLDEQFNPDDKSTWSSDQWDKDI